MSVGLGTLLPTRSIQARTPEAGSSRGGDTRSTSSDIAAPRRWMGGAARVAPRPDHLYSPRGTGAISPLPPVPRRVRGDFRHSACIVPGLLLTWLSTSPRPRNLDDLLALDAQAARLVAHPAALRADPGVADGRRARRPSLREGRGGLLQRPGRLPAHLRRGDEGPGPPGRVLRRRGHPRDPALHERDGARRGPAGRA